MTTQTKTTTQFVVHFTNENDWLIALGNSYQNYRHAGWEFVTTLQIGIDQFGANKAELYQRAADATELTVKTLQNYVSMARKRSSEIAASYGLEIGHAVAVLGLEDAHADAVLLQAAEERLSVDSVKAIVREYKQGADLPVVGNERAAVVVAPNHDDEPPFSNRNSVLYADDDTDAKAEHLAGSASAYNYTDDDESDQYTYTGAEFHSLLQRATHRLRDNAALWEEQRTINEWLSLVATQAY